MCIIHGAKYSRIDKVKFVKNLKEYGPTRQPISHQIFKGCLPQDVLGPFLDIFYPHMVTQENLISVITMPHLSNESLAFWSISMMPNYVTSRTNIFAI